MHNNSIEAQRIEAEWLQTPRSIKISNAIALGVGMGLVAGGGIANLAVMIPSMVAACFLIRPTAPLVLAAFIAFGNVSADYMDAGQPVTGSTIPALTTATIYALAGYAAYLGSKRLIRWLQKREKHRLIKFLPVIYLTTYFVLTVIMGALLSPGDVS